ncbi:MAG: alpha/beta hydrolase [Phycisphaeraceae bacterium]
MSPVFSSLSSPPVADEQLIRCDKVLINRANFGTGGPPLVLLHGVVRRWQDFEPLIEPLSSQWRLHLLDHRGHGRSSRGDGYRVIDYVADVVSYLEKELREPAVLLGHSLGAMVAAAVAARAGESVRAIILEDPPFETMGRSISETPILAVMQAMRDAIEHTDGSVDVMADHLAATSVPTSDMKGAVTLGELRSRESLRFSASCLADLDSAVLTPIIAGRWLDGFEVTSTLECLRCPTLLIQADPSCGGMLSDERVLQARKLIPRCTAVRMAGVGHHLHGADPSTLLRHIQLFLETV